MVETGSKPGIFKVGDDPRRNHGGRLPYVIRELRDKMAERSGEAVEKLWLLTAHENPNIALAATIEWLDRTLGKPKPMDQDTEANVRAELKAVFTKLRERLSPAVYDQIIEVVTEK